MAKYRLTIIGLIIAVIVFACSLLFELDLFEQMLALFESLEHFEVDEIVIPSLILLLFAFIDLRRRQNKQDVEQEKFKIYKAMMFSTQHILNNFLNEMQVFKMTAEETSDFDPEILGLYDEVIKESSTQIDALGSITQIDEATIHETVRPH